MIHGVEGIEPSRRQRLIELLDIDLNWRLNRISDGQRRRVQICMGLLKPYKVSVYVCTGVCTGHLLVVVLYPSRSTLVSAAVSQPR